jgi:CheY-like chemotaxis protein
MHLIVVAEDDSDTRSVVSSLLADAGYSVAEASDAATTLRKLKSLRPNLVVLDYGLPAPKDGEEFLRAKAADPEIASIPVLLVSGYLLPREMDGIVSVLRKPFDVEDLLAAIDNALRPPEKPKTSAV